MTLAIEYVPLDRLVRHDRNPKSHDIPTLVESFRRFGFADPVVVDERTGKLAAGHGRLTALESMREQGDGPPSGVRVEDGVWLVPQVSGWASTSDREYEAALVALNRTTEAGGWADDKLLSILDDLGDDGGLDGVGFDGDDIADLRERLAALDRADPWSNRNLQPMPDAGDVEVGQLWKVGPHLLACGDARDPEVWARLMGGAKVRMLFTDPPYGIDYTGGGVERHQLEGDSPADAPQLLADVLDTLGRWIEPGAASYVLLPPGDQIPPTAEVLAQRQLWRWTNVWVKDNATFGRADYHQQHELIVYGWWPGAARLQPLTDRTQTTVWQIPRPSDSDDHPTQKPVELVERALRNSSHEGWIVADPFAGSGTTLVAAARTGRVGVGIELEPAYAAVTVRRMETATGQTAELVDATIGAAAAG